jgi:hypothetical protein
MVVISIVYGSAPITSWQDFMLTLKAKLLRPSCQNSTGGTQSAETQLVLLLLQVLLVSQVPRVG